MNGKKVKTLIEKFEYIVRRKPSKKELRRIKKEYNDGVKIWHQD